MLFRLFLYFTIFYGIIIVIINHKGKFLCILFSMFLILKSFFFFVHFPFVYTAICWCMYALAGIQFQIPVCIPHTVCSQKRNKKIRRNIGDRFNSFFVVCCCCCNNPNVCSRTVDMAARMSVLWITDTHDMNTKCVLKFSNKKKKKEETTVSCYLTPVRWWNCCCCSRWQKETIGWCIWNRMCTFVGTTLYHEIMDGASETKKQIVMLSSKNKRQTNQLLHRAVSLNLLPNDFKRPTAVSVTKYRIKIKLWIFVCAGTKNIFDQSVIHSWMKNERNVKNQIQLRGSSSLNCWRTVGNSST